jgi:hypothetical protein
VSAVKQIDMERTGGKNSNTDHLKRSKEKQKCTKKRKEDQDGPDDPEYGAGKH